MCNNGLCGNNSLVWIIILAVLFCGCGNNGWGCGNNNCGCMANNCGCGNNNCGCGCENNCGCC